MKGLSIYYNDQDLLHRESFDKDLYQTFYHHSGKSFSGIELHFFEFQAKKSHTLYSEYDKPGYKIALCLNGYSENLSPQNERYVFEEGKALIYRVREGKSKSFLKEENQMSILHLYLSEMFFEENQFSLQREYLTIPYKTSFNQLQRLVGFSKTSSFCEKAQMESTLFELLSTLFVWTEKYKQNYVSKNTLIARDFLDATKSQFVTIHELSKIAGMNEYRLKKEFKQLTGKGVFGYQQDQRMEQALLLLKNGNTIEEVAAIIGYSSAGNFSNTFYKKYGYRPGEIKKS